MRNVLFFLLINSCFCANILQAQTIMQTYVQAQKNFAEGKYTYATELYERILYFLPENDTLKPEIYASLAQIYMQSRQYNNAETSLGKALSLSPAASRKTQNLLILKSKAFLFQHQYAAALANLYLIDTLQFPEFARQLNFYSGMAYFGLQNYPEAQNCFYKVVANAKDKKLQISNLFRKNKKIKFINSKVAVGLSVIIPGAGQIYAGYPDRGINSLLLTSAFAVLGYNSYLSYGFIKSMAAIFPWYARYYGFGLADAYILAKKTRNKKHQGILNQMLKVMAEN